MNLKIDDDNEITLPAWIAGSKLSLTEIGAIACIACLQGHASQLAIDRIGDPEMAAAMTSLREKKVLEVSLDGNRLALNIFLDDFEPDSPTNDKCAATGSERNDHE